MIKLFALALALALALPAVGCRTGMRRVTSAIEGQGVSTVDYKTGAEGVEFNYLTSENSAFEVDGLELEIDPASGKWFLKAERGSLVRTPADNQQYFAGQLAQGRAADTEAIAGYAAITGAVVEGAVKAAVEAALPAYAARQTGKTDRRRISADRDVALAELHGAAEEGHHEEPAAEAPVVSHPGAVAKGSR